MFNRLATFMFALLLCCTPAKSATSAQMLAVTIPATYSYQINVDGQWTIAGSAFMYDEGLFHPREIVTAKHVAQLGDAYPARLCESKPEPKCYLATGHRDHTVSDVSIVEVHGKPAKRRLARDLHYAVGDEVYIIGYPYGELNVTKGIVSMKSEDLLYTDARCIPGNSGGVAISSDGDVIGVVSAIRFLHNGQFETNWCYLIPASKIGEIE